MFRKMKLGIAAVAVLGLVAVDMMHAGHKPVLFSAGFLCNVPGINGAGMPDQAFGAPAFRSLASLQDNGRAKIVCRANVVNVPGVPAVFRRFPFAEPIPAALPGGPGFLTTDITSLRVPATGLNARIVLVYNINVHVT